VVNQLSEVKYFKFLVTMEKQQPARELKHSVDLYSRVDQLKASLAADFAIAAEQQRWYYHN